MRLSLELLLLLGALHAAMATNCHSKTECGKCIADAKCAWCAHNVTGNHQNRCQSASLLNWCNGALNNPSNAVGVVENESLGPSHQITPQKVKIRARPGQKSHFEVEYEQKDDPPLDLYYLMDLSDSMNDDKERLCALGNELAARMKKRSNNLRMGFGSFVDKRIMPFTNTNRNQRNCVNCVPTYLFKNHLALTDNTDKFAQSVGETKISENIDYPEGGLEALMQVMVCKEEIGWRNDSLRMIIFSTDAESHYAGAGKLGGIVHPNDELCHMKDGDYTHDLEHDYPSVLQIERIATRENMRIVFAVTENVLDTYYKLGWIISAPKNITGLLEKDSDKLIRLIEEAYDSLTQKVNMETDNSQDVSVEFTSSCLENTTLLKTTKGCDVKGSGDKVKFNVTVEVKACPADKAQRKQTIKITPDTARKHRVVVELEIVCECDCEKTGISSHAECNGNGNLTCGTCICDAGYGGKSCSCKTDLQDFDADDYSACQQNADGITCSKRGECVCQQCKCNAARFSGEFCQCDSKNCVRGTDTNICSGNGKCECNDCMCNEGWKGKFCACTASEEQCRNDKGEICSGRGQCECGVCKCDSIPSGGRFTGKFCDDCPTCKEKCDELQHCVENQLFYPESSKAPECKLTYELHRVEELTEELIQEALVSHHVKKRESNNGDYREPFGEESNVQTESVGNEATPTPRPRVAAHLCSYADNQGCSYNFKYISVGNRLHVFATGSKDCGEPVEVIAVVLGLVAAIFVAGVVMLVIWKVATTIHDRREFTKFENERKAAMFSSDSNPLYKDPASTFQNPTFAAS